MSCSSSSLPTIARAAELVRSGQLEPIELVQFCLDRIGRFDPQVRAWVVVEADRARRDAERLGKLARAGNLLGPLHGIPIGIKDILDVQGIPTRAGSPLREDHVAEQDAPVVAALRRHGAIVLGKTVTTEFACFDPPPTKNPWNLTHTPGGSSSGSAAAVAMQMCMAALGSQTGGSIIRPASYCGVAGMKPRFGSVSLVGVVPVSPRLDHVGPIARGVGDLALLLSAISKAEPAGVSTGWSDRPAGEAPPTLSVIEEFFLQEASRPVHGLTQTALDKLRNAGAKIRPMPLPPGFADVHAMHRRIMAADVARYHRDQFSARREAFGPKLAALIEEGLAISPSELAAAVEHQRRFRRELGEALKDVIAVTPATDTTAPGRLDTTGDPKFNSPWSYAGVPAASIPCGLAENGMPCSLQLITAGDPFDLLRAAAWCEQVLGFRCWPPLLNS